MFIGRIHSAVISGLNVDARSVTVEWFEKNEIKGKEVCELCSQVEFCCTNSFWL